MKKIMLLAGFLLIMVFPPKAWDQTYGTGGGAEYMRQMQQQTINKKPQVQQQQQTENNTDGLEQKQLKTPDEERDQDDKQKN